ISERTVKIHVANVIAKLGVTNRTAAVVRAIDLDLISHRDS
ncbi:MAG: LuxR C-terminal-related transcriptional regulator, partial [Chloroflexota bacterium]|nr:LuxR C-terminal-related transcriptional regulator [Chloroflexota bacterium]